jgi:TRAP-type C4-dicarboxylate transport system substrate-binding protein
MRLDQLQGASITSIGLAQIVPSVLLLQQPALFRNYKELDYVREKMDAELRKKFEEKGFVLLGWGDVGYVYLYSSKKIDSVEALKSTKIWGWTDDPITKQFSDDAGVTPHMLGILDVRSALQTGAVDTVIGTPLSVIAMQWHSYLKFRVAYRFAIGVGATVITKKSFDALSPELQKTLLELSAKHHQSLVKVIRSDNNKALKALKERGVQAVNVPKEEKALIRKISKKTRDAFVGKLYTAEELKRVQALLAEFRKSKK